MFHLILDLSILSALFFFAVSLEGCPPSATFLQNHSDFTGMVSRYVILALAAFPWITFTRLRAGEKALQRVGSKLLLSAGVFSGRAYLSEVLISALVSIIVLGSFAARRWIRRFLSRKVALAGSDCGTESSD